MQHWDGTAWTDLALPPVAARWGLTGIGGVSREDLWTAGHVMSTTSRGVALHWDGQHWQQPAVPTPDRQDAQLSDVIALTSDDVWAAGTGVR
jgi:hypothetical protein